MMHCVDLDNGRGLASSASVPGSPGNLLFAGTWTRAILVAAEQTDTGQTCLFVSIVVIIGHTGCEGQIALWMSQRSCMSARGLI